MNKVDRPIVSIGIPTYNRADGLLKNALQSALNQTYENVEVVVSDNCSSDNTAEFVRSFENPRLRYFRHDKNIGPVNNFNYCLEKANGDYFLLLHDDDLIDPDFVETCMQHANFEKHYGIIRTGTRLIDENGNVLSESPNRAAGLSSTAYFRAWFQSKVAWYLPSTLFNTNALKEIGGFCYDYNLIQDAVALVKLESHVERLDIEDIKAGFRKHSGELTFAVRVRDWASEYYRLLNLICETLPGTDASFKYEGMRFFAGLCYKRASAVTSPYRRFFAYLSVWKTFKYRHFPPFFNSWLRRNFIYFSKK